MILWCLELKFQITLEMMLLFVLISDISNRSEIMISWIGMKEDLFAMPKKSQTAEAYI